MKKVAESVVVELPGRDRIEAVLGEDGAKKVLLKLNAKGCLPLLKLIDRWRDYIKKNVQLIPCPEGKEHHDLLLKELVLKIKGEWQIVYPHVELCHCRVVQTQVVESAIVSGAHSLEKVSRVTSAGTGCGTCRSDIEEILKYRVKDSEQG